MKRKKTLTLKVKAIKKGNFLLLILLHFDAKRKRTEGKFSQFYWLFFIDLGKIPESQFFFLFHLFLIINKKKKNQIKH